MKPRITDPEVALLASLASGLEREYIAPTQEDPWSGSPFAWILKCPSRRRGKIGEQLVAGWCAAKGLDVLASGDSEADRVIAGRRVEIKFSTLWASGSYKFQQLRDQRYDAAICLGISPFDAHCWVIEKEQLHRHVLGQLPQHAGRRGTDTFWFTVVPNQAPDWLSGCGGRLSDAFTILKRWQAHRPSSIAPRAAE
ncbi:MAG: hypothetical protein NZ533_03985 [Casimicrobiaceae bacterium]|nr:hypothetical protein [Casimicrobiaceae bacterium]